MRGTSGARPRRPAGPPTAADLAERDAFQQLAARALPEVRASAEAWRNGLATFITLITTAVIITGRGATHQLAVEWRLIVSLLVAGGLVLAVSGLWHALAAQAGGSPHAWTRDTVREQFGSVQAMETAMAYQAARRLVRARYLVATAIALLLAGTVSTWWAPPATPDPPAYVRVTHKDMQTCGKLRSGDRAHLRVLVTGNHHPTVISYRDVTNLEVVARCG